MGNEQTKPTKATSPKKPGYAVDAIIHNNNNNQGHSFKAAKDWFNDGVEHTCGDTDKALEAFNRAIGLDRKYADAYALKGNILRMKGKFQEALEVLDQAISIDSQCTLAYYNKAKVLVLQSKKQEAENCFVKGSKTPQNQNSFIIALDIGATLCLIGKPQDAINWCDYAMQLNPRSPAPYSFKGYSLYALNRHQEAIDCYNKGLQLQPDYPLVDLNKGFSLYRLGRHQEAINCYDKALQIGFDMELHSINAYLNKGYSLFALGRHSEAVICYDKTLRLKSTSWEAYLNKGYSLSFLNQYEDAVRCHKQALKLNPESFEASLNIGNCLYAQGKYQDAIKWFDNTISMKPTNYRAYSSKGYALERLGRHNEAAAAKKKADSLKAMLGDAAGVISAEEWFNRAQIAQKNNNHPEAIEAYNKAMSIKPAYANYIPTEYREALLRKVSNLQQTTNNTEAMVAQLRDRDSEQVRNLVQMFRKLQEEQNAVTSKVKNLLDKNDAGEDTSGVEKEMMRVDKEMLALQQEMLNIKQQQEYHSKQHEEHIKRLDQHEQKLFDLETQTTLLIDLSAKGQATVDMIKSTLFTNIKLQEEHKQEVDVKLSIIVSEVAKGKAKSDLVQHMLKDINETVKEHGILLDQYEQKLFDLVTQTKLLIDLSAQGQATVDMIKSTLFTTIKLQAEHKQEVDVKLSIITSEVAKGKAKSDLVQHMLKDINEIVKEHRTRPAVESHAEQQQH